MSVPDLNELDDLDLSMPEQLRRCRELLAANLCSQGVRALPTEPLTQLIGKVTKIDRRRQMEYVDTLLDHIDSLKSQYSTYVTALQTFAKNNQCDYALCYSAAHTYDRRTPAANNLTSATTYIDPPTTFNIGGVNINIPPTNVLLVGGVVQCSWGTTSAAYARARSVGISGVRQVSDIRTFANLSSVIEWTTSGTNQYYGGVHYIPTTATTVAVAGVGYSNFGHFYRDSSTGRYTSYELPVNTTYDYWYNNTVLNNPVWAVKLPTLGTAPGNPFPTISIPDTPDIPKLEYY